MEKGLQFLNLEDAVNYTKSNENEELSAHVLSDKTSVFACAAYACNQDDTFKTYFTCLFDNALEEGEGLVTGLRHV